MFSAGIHPHDAKSWMEGYLEELREMARSPECVAVGECGLDYNRDFSPVDIQKEVFEKQVWSITCCILEILILNVFSWYSLVLPDKSRAITLK